MIPERIDRLEDGLRKADDLPAESREELLQLVRELRQELAPLADQHSDDAGNIAAFAEASLSGARGDRRNPTLVGAAIGDLTASVEKFEASHPRLVDVVNRIAVALANMGI